MLPIARILGGATAVFVAALTGCEYYPPTQDASSQNTSSEASNPASTAALEQELKEAQAKLEAAHVQAASSRGVADITPGGAQARQVSSAAPLTPFTAGGEERIECPAGFMAQDSKDTGCACVASEDANTVSPFKEPPCSTTARAEAGECIFSCAAAAPAAPPASP